MYKLIFALSMVALSTTAHAQDASTPLAERNATWVRLSKEAVEASAAQNGGRPNLTRICQPELGVCNMAIMTTDSKGAVVMLREATNASGNVVKRDVCMFGEYGDTRTCRNFDTGKRTVEMQDGSGAWRQVAGRN